MPLGRRPGSWLCLACRKLQTPERQTCVACGEPRPTKAKPNPRRGRRPASPRARSEKQRKAERESGVGSTDMKRLRSMNEREKRRARGRALANSPMALDIEASVARRLAERKRREEAEGEV